jgi:hypothetical protein
VCGGVLHRNISYIVRQLLSLIAYYCILHLCISVLFLLGNILFVLLNDVYIFAG